MQGRLLPTLQVAFKPIPVARPCMLGGLLLGPLLCPCCWLCGGTGFVSARLKRSSFSAQRQEEQAMHSRHGPGRAPLSPAGDALPRETAQERGNLLFGRRDRSRSACYSSAGHASGACRPDGGAVAVRHPVLGNQLPHTRIMSLIPRLLISRRAWSIGFTSSTGIVVSGQTCLSARTAPCSASTALSVRIERLSIQFLEASCFWFMRYPM